MWGQKMKKILIIFQIFYIKLKINLHFPHIPLFMECIVLEYAII